MPLVEFDLVIAASKWLQTHAFDRATTGVGFDMIWEK
jgi:hypothetical protein